MPTQAEQDYLKALYHLTSARPAVGVGELAVRVGVSHPSASAMVKKLAASGLVGHERSGALRLTSSGEAEALRVVRRHRLLETFLAEVLRLPWDEVHEEAEVLEHALSDRLEHRIAEYLGNPARDPHGDPIPPAEGSHVEHADQPLGEAGPGTDVRIERVSDHDPGVLRHLAAEGLTPGVVITVDHQDPFGGPLWVSSARGRHALGPQLVASISVSTLSRAPAGRGRKGRS